MKARAPSPDVSAILARHSSTSLRALVRPFSRSSARAASVGIFGIGTRLVLVRLFVVRSGLDLQIEQRGAEGLAGSIERACHAAAERAGHHEIQRRNVGQLIADNLALDNTCKMRPDPLAGDFFQQ